PEGDGQLLVRRVVAGSGRGRVYLNGGLATGAQLAEGVGPLIDVASQHEHQSLGEGANHLEALGAFGRHGELRGRMAATHEELRAAEQGLAELTAAERSRAEREDFLRFQLRQIDEIAPQPDEDATLLKQRDRLRAAGRLQGAARRSEEVLYAGEGAAADRLAAVVRELAPLGALDEALAPIARQLEDARAAIEDAAFRLRRYADAVAADPDRLTQIEERLDAIGKLLRKHGPTVRDLEARRADMAAELDRIERGAERQAAAEARRAAADGA